MNEDGWPHFGQPYRENVVGEDGKTPVDIAAFLMRQCTRADTTPLDGSEATWTASPSRSPSNKKIRRWCSECARPS
jgi:hypothetical protein